MRATDAPLRQNAVDHLFLGRLATELPAKLFDDLRPIRSHLPKLRSKPVVVLTYNLLVVSTAETKRADALFHALADPTRRDILSVVLRDAHSVSDLARRYPISFAAVHKHVGALERALLVTKTRVWSDPRQDN